MDEQEWPPELDRRIAAVVTAEDPYQAALQVTSLATDFLRASVVTSRLYQIWAAPQDRIEMKLDEELEGVAAMRRAASDWLAAKDDSATREAYLDRWQYDILGYRRHDD